MIILLGASGGLGRKLAPSLTHLDSVVATYHTKPLNLKKKNLEEKRLDLTSPGEIKKFADWVCAKHHRLTLVNLASFSPDGLLVQTDYEHWKKSFQIHADSNFLLLKKLLPRMMEDRWGRLIFISSITAQTGPVGAGAYASSKAALSGLCRTAAHEYGRFGITANLLRIGYFDQGLIHTLDATKQKEILKRIPSQKFGDTNNLFHAVDFIMKADYLNGAEIPLDGGFF